MTQELVLGLHISKCAGTSLVSFLRRRMTEDQYYFCSGFPANYLASRLEFYDLVSPQRLRVIFGHYVHESMLRLYEDQAIWLFTGLREPHARAVSEYSHLCAVSISAGRSAPSVDHYLSVYRDSTCKQILRAFPSVARRFSHEPIHLQAARALTLFDFVYSSDDFEKSSNTILGRLGIEGSVSLFDNERSALWTKTKPTWKRCRS